VRAALIPILAAAAIVVAGCGKSTIKESGAEKAVIQVVTKQSGFHPTDVKCPSGVEAKAGTSFDCHFTGPQSKTYTANVKITKVQGSRVEFFIRAEPSG
jgi:hypothetical protein